MRNSFLLILAAVLIPGHGAAKSDTDCTRAERPPVTVLQFIDGELTRWRDYGDGCVYLERPDRGWLDAPQADELQQRSRAWQPTAARTATTIPLHELAANPADTAMPATVIGDEDERERVDATTILTHPWRSVGFHRHDFSEGSSYRCTGTLIAPHLVLTNAHCIHRDQYQGRIVASEFAPAQHQVHAEGEIIRPFGSAPAYDFIANDDWLVEEDSPHDYGLLLLSRPFEDIDSFMPLVFDDPGTPILHIAGYPAVVHEDTPEYEPWSKTQWYSQSSNAQVGTGPNDRLILHDADTSGGNSGSPIWREDAGQARIIGVHCCGSSIGQINWGPRLRADNLDFIESWLDWQPPPPPDSADDFGLHSLPPGSGQLSADNTGATRQLREPDHCAQATGRSLWWRWQAPVARTVTFAVTSEEMDAVLAVYRGEHLDQLEPLDCSSQSEAALELAGEPGQDWQIVVDGLDRSEGAFELDWSIAPPDNDPVEQARLISAEIGSDSGDSYGAGLGSGQSGQICGQTISQAVWWQIAPADEAAWARFQVSGATGPLVVALYPADSELTADPVACSAGSAPVRLNAELAANQAYRLMLGTNEESLLELDWQTGISPDLFFDRFEGDQGAGETR